MINQKLSEMLQSALDGEVSFCEVFKELKDIENHLEVVFSQVKEGARNEALEFTKGESYYGGKWTLGNSQTYLVNKDDKEWLDLNDATKARQKVLMSAWKSKQDPKNFYDDDFVFIDEETGESVDIMDVKTPAKEWVSFKIDKPKGPEQTNEGKKLIFD